MDKQEINALVEHTKSFNNHNNSSLLSVVVVTHNPTQELLECLDSLKNQVNQNFSVILIDNGDSLPMELENRSLQYIKLNKNYGPSIARNVGAFLSKSKIVAFLDDDGIAEPKWTQDIIQYFETNNILALRGKVLPKTKNNYFNLIAYHYDMGSKVVAANLNLEGNCAILREEFIEIGGFKNFLFGHEGEELTSKLLHQYPGKEILYAPDVIIRHDYCDSIFHYIYKRFRQGKNNSFHLLDTRRLTSNNVIFHRTLSEKIIIALLEKTGNWIEFLGKLARTQD